MAKQTKRIKLGNVIVENKKDKNGQEYTSRYIGLGQQGSKNPDFDLTVELTVKDSKGKVIASQTNGFLSVVDPRTQPQELLSAGLISEEIAEKMQERVSKIPTKIKQELWLNLK